MGEKIINNGELKAETVNINSLYRRIGEEDAMWHPNKKH